MAGQLLWVKNSFPDTQLTGSEVWLQPGLNQSFLQIEGLATELKKRYVSLLPGWHVLGLVGFTATFVVLSLVKKFNVHFAHFKMLGTCLGFYALFLVFNPRTFILPEAYGVYLAFTLIIALFVLLPAWLEKFNNHSGIFVLIFFVLAFCWSCIQLRNYSLYYPL
jgi:hypothetical protein